MDIIFGMLIVAYIQLSAANPVGTPCVCPRQYEPVCGSNGQTYNNQCLLDCISTTNSYLKLAKFGACEQNNSGVCGCSLDYIPVCGSDGRTYPNNCHLSCKYRDDPSLNLAYEGECRLGIPNPNTCICSNDYNPVCGSDGITYNNDCLLNCATAKNSRLGIAYYSRCRSNTLARDAVNVVTPKFK